MSLHIAALPYSAHKPAALPSPALPKQVTGTALFVSHSRALLVQPGHCRA